MAINGTTAWDLRNVALHLGTLSPSGLSALKHMWLPVATPYEAVPAFTSGTPSLESLLVDDFDPAAGRLDFGHLGTLESLRTLQIRSTHGIKLPAFSFAGGTDALASLVNLRVLELTGLRGASAADFNFIGSLQHLQSLALGECSLWDSSVYRALGGLSKLTRLRLEVYIAHAFVFSVEPLFLFHAHTPTLYVSHCPTCRTPTGHIIPSRCAECTLMRFIMHCSFHTDGDE